MSTIVFEQVTKRYVDGHEAVRALDLEVADGEFMILVGPSGCGKSTALRMIAGLEDITDGRLWIGDDVVNDRAPKDRDIAMVFQNYALYPHMTVRANMGFALKLGGMKRAEIDRVVTDVAEVLGLTEHLERKPAHLSGGQRQRVAMGRAIVREPKAFLMDEPLSNLDAKLRVEMRAAVSRLQQRLGTTTVYVTHDQTEAMTLGDRVAVMRSGVLQQVGTPRELYERPCNLFVAAFIGSPAMNLFTARIEDDAIHTSIGAIPLDARLRSRLQAGGHAGSQVVLGVRPEDFQDAELVPPGVEGWTFDVRVELAESLGSEIYVHFGAQTAGGPTGETAAELRELREVGGTGDEAAEGAGGGSRAVARVDAASRLGPGDRGRLWLDTRRLYVFDADDGRALVATDARAPMVAGS